MFASEVPSKFCVSKGKNFLQQGTNSFLKEKPSIKWDIIHSRQNLSPLADVPIHLNGSYLNATKIISYVLVKIKSSLPG